MRCYLLNIFIIICLFYNLPAQAFDGNRKGFIIGGAVGGGIMSYNKDIKAENMPGNNREFLKVFALDFIIGYGITNNFFIFYNNKELWTVTETLSGEKAVFVNSMGPFGFSYYFKDESPSFFLNLGAGFAHFYAPFKNNQELDYGMGIYTGIGYEFMKHCSLNITYMISRTRREEAGININSNTSSLLFTISFIAY